MLNRDLNSRFEDWLLNPRETLDFEVKQWLDMGDVESHGLVAKALIALENHGGGFLLFGYRQVNGALEPDPNRPSSLEPYLTDSMNAIVKKRAEPPFHVEVTLQRHPATGDEYPLVRVSGSSRTPVRSDSATPGNSLRQNVYYIRAPGPESRAPLNGVEWDALIRRVVQNQREEIIGILRSFQGAERVGMAAAPPSELERLQEFAARSIARWSTLNESLPDGAPGKVTKGFFAFAARIAGTSKGLSAREILGANQGARRYTGWPAFVEMPQEATRPRLIEGGVEAWLGPDKHADAGHADYWRIEPSGNFILLRGYQEDSVDAHRGFATPGTVLELTLPVWRLGEFLLRIADLGAAMFEEGFKVVAACDWRGLNGRRLASYNMRRMVPGTYVSQADDVHTSGEFTQQTVRELLPETVQALTAPLYEHFDFFNPPASFYKEELEEMLKNRF